MDSVTNRNRRHSDCDKSGTDLRLKRSRVQDCIKEQSRCAEWRNLQESVSKALTPSWVVDKTLAKPYLCATSTFSGECSTPTRLMQSFHREDEDETQAGFGMELRTNLQITETAASTDDPFVVEDPRYHDVGLLLTLGESNSPCSTKERADIDLALAFKYTHLT